MSGTKTDVDVWSAILKVQESMDVVSKDTSNPFFKSVYADLPAIMSMLKPLLVANNLVLLQPMIEPVTDNFIRMTTILHHTVSKSNLEFTTSMPMEKINPQGYGSAVTYLRRYTIGSLFGIITDIDDDANKAMGYTDGPLPISDISEKQQKMVYAVANKHGWSNDDLMGLLTRAGIRSVKAIPVNRLQGLITTLEKGNNAVR